MKIEIEEILNARTEYLKRNYFRPDTVIVSPETFREACQYVATYTQPVLNLTYVFGMRMLPISGIKKPRAFLGNLK